MRVNMGIATIPRFWVDVPTSSKGIRLVAQLLRPEADNEVGRGKEFGPAGLLPSKELHGGKILEILVIRDNVDNRCRALKVVPPVPERLVNSG